MINFFKENWIFFLTTTFLLWLLFFANYGLLDYFILKNQIKLNELKLNAVKKEVHIFSSYIQGFNSEELELDLLEFQVRKILGFVRKNEAIYFWKEEEK